MPSTPSTRWIPGFAARKLWAVLLGVPQRVLVGLVKAYRLFISPALGPVCRYEPSCSAYALQALQRHGALAGSALAAKRVLRCNPWCAGGHDHVPRTLQNGWLFKWTSEVTPLASDPSTDDMPEGNKRLTSSASFERINQAQP